MHMVYATIMVKKERERWGIISQLRKLCIYLLSLFVVDKCIHLIYIGQLSFFVYLNKVGHFKFQWTFINDFCNTPIMQYIYKVNQD